MFRYWQRLQDRERIAEVDATLLIARFGIRATYMASRRLTQMQNGAVSNRPPFHWKRVHSIVSELLPYDGDDEGRTTSALPNAEL
jgi:hypothetical protein